VGEILQRVFNCFNYYITTGVENITRGYKLGNITVFNCFNYFIITDVENITRGLQMGEILQRVFNCFNYSITTGVENITRGYKWGKYYKEYLIVLIILSPLLCSLHL
jgi:hypothetical protein